MLCPECHGHQTSPVYPYCTRQPQVRLHPDHADAEFQREVSRKIREAFQPKRESSMPATIADQLITEFATSEAAEAYLVSLASFRRQCPVVVPAAFLRRRGNQIWHMGGSEESVVWALCVANVFHAATVAERRGAIEERRRCLVESDAELTE